MQTFSYSKVHDGSIAQCVDISEVDCLLCAIDGITLGNLLAQSVTAAHGLGLAREEGAELVFAEIGTKSRELLEEIALGLLSLGVGVADLKCLGAGNILVIVLAESHASCTTPCTADNWVLYFHNLVVLMGSHLKKGGETCRLFGRTYMKINNLMRLIVLAGWTFGHCQGAETNGRNGSVLGIRYQRNSMNAVGVLPAGWNGGNQGTIGNLAVFGGQRDSALGFVDDDGNEVKASKALVGLNAGVKDNIDRTVGELASRNSKIHDGGIAHGVDVGIVDCLFGAINLIALGNLLTQSVTARHGLGFAREEETELVIAEVAAQSRERSEESALGLLSRGFGVRYLKSLGASHILVIILAEGHATCTAASAADDWVLNFHNL